MAARAINLPFINSGLQAGDVRAESRQPFQRLLEEFKKLLKQLPRERGVGGSTGLKPGVNESIVADGYGRTLRRTSMSASAKIFRARPILRAN
jgi:hypothetical protein